MEQVLASDFVAEHWLIYFRDVFQLLIGYVAMYTCRIRNGCNFKTFI